MENVFNDQNNSTFPTWSVLKSFSEKFKFRNLCVMDIIDLTF